MWSEGGYSPRPRSSFFPKIHLINILRWLFVVVEISKGSFDWKLKGPLLIVKKNINQTFVIEILFIVVKRSGNYVFENNLPLQPSAQGLHIRFLWKEWVLKLQIVLIGLEIRCSSSLFKSQSDRG